MQYTIKWNKCYVNNINLDISCKCEKRPKAESHDDYFIPLSDPRSAKCGDPLCRKKGTLKCMFCEEVYCKACIKVK